MAVSNSGVRYYVAINGQMQVVSALNSMESSAVRTDTAMANLASTMRTIGSTLGVGFGLHSLIEFGKDAVQGAADYEAAMKRIKFASQSAADGLSNQNFILAEASKFKIPFEDATEAYGKFLAMLSGSKMATRDIQQLHDQLLLIGKVKGLSDGQMDAAVMNLGKMLESGGLDARHFRPLEMQLSGVGQYVANELGISIHQLAVLRNKGMMSQIDPQVLLTAIKKQAADLQGFLPESLTTIQSGLNEVHNAWLNFKNDLVFENKDALIGLFDAMKDGIGWLKEHEGTLTFIGKELIFLGKVWVGYKATMALLNVAASTYQGFMAGYLGQTASVVGATEARAVAFNQLAAAMERLVYVQAQQAGMPTLAAMSAANAARLSGGAIAAEEGAAAVGVASLSTIASTVAAVLGFAAISKIATDWWNEKYGLGRDTNNDKYYYDVETHSIRPKESEDKEEKYNYNTSGTMSHRQDMADFRELEKERDKAKYGLPSFLYSSSETRKKDAFTRIAPPVDKVTGQRIVNITNTFKEINGVKSMTVEKGSDIDTDAIGKKIRDVLVEIANDQMIRQGE